MNDIKDFVIENGVLMEYTGNGGDVEIPAGVTSIGNSAFRSCSSLTSVTIPENVTSIGNWAFTGCSNLTSVTIPESVTSIGHSAFSGCSSLTGVTIPESVTSIGDWAFNGCSGLTGVTIPEGVTSIGDRAFEDCRSLTGVTIPEGVTSIGDRAFRGCSGLTSVTIPASVTSIGDSAFRSCSSLMSVTIPEGVTSIGGWAFNGCSSLTSVTIPASVTSIGNWAFQGCSNLTSVTIPESVTSIGHSAFSGCSSLTGVTIPESVTSIGDRAFNGCSSLTGVTIPESVTSIGDRAFEGCSGLSSVTIPGSVTEIEDRAFQDCTSLTSVTIPESVQKIGSEAFYGCTSLKSVALPNSVRTLGERAFGNCPGLVDESGLLILGGILIRYFGDSKELIIPTGVRRIEHQAFYNSRELISVSIPEGVTNIGQEAFYGCAALTSVTIPDSVTSIGKFAFNTRAWPKKTELIVNFRKTTKLAPGLQDCDIQPNTDDLACMILYQGSKEWTAWLDQQVKGEALTIVYQKVVSLVRDSPNLSKAVINNVSGFLARHRDDLTLEAVQEMVTLLNGAGSKAGKTKAKKEPQTSDQPMDKMAMVIAQSKSNLLKWAKKYSLDLDKLGKVGLKGQKSCAPVENVLFMLFEYAKQMPKLTRYDKDDCMYKCLDIQFSEEAESIADQLDRASLQRAIKHMVSGKIDTSEKRLELYFPYCRFAEDKDIANIVAIIDKIYMPKSDYWRSLIVLRNALLLSDTQEAAACLERLDRKIKDKSYYSYTRSLNKYAKMRGVSTFEIRDSIMLPAFDFDADGIKRYDIGGNTIEVSIAPDLSFRLFDVNKQKEIRSFPKKSDDPTKAETCAKKFAAFKKEVLAFAKERTELLHRMHMSGEYVRADLWKKVYVEHPVISKLARLVVWQDEAGKTFMIADDGIIDSQNSAYAAQGKIRVAHVLDMDAADITAWQQWLAKRGCVQLFEQVWEPVIQYNQGALTKRYSGVTFTNEERNTVKKALKLRGVDMRAAEMDREYNHRAGEWIYSNEGAMLFGKCMRLDYTVDENTKAITFGKASARADTGNREMNATLLEMDKATLSAQITRDNDTALTDQALSVFSAAQIAGLLNLAIDRKVNRCTARLLDYKNARFPEFAEVSEFSLDW